MNSEIDKANAELERVQHETASEMESLADVENELTETRGKLQALQSEQNDGKEKINELKARQYIYSQNSVITNHFSWPSQAKSSL